MYKIAITMTAMDRPELISTTVRSFGSKLFIQVPKDNLYLSMNIDPIGTDCILARHYWEMFDEWSRFVYKWNATIHLPPKAHFPTAFIHTWKTSLTTTCDYIFHLEDDWELLTEVPIAALFDLFERHDDLDILRLSAFRSDTDRCKNWDKFLEWNGEFFEVPEDLRGLLGFAGHPSLIRRRFVENTLPHLDPNKNPEKQIDGHHPQIGPYLKSKRFGLWIPQNHPPIVRDIGRKWMVENGYRKKGNKAWFTEWEKVREQ